MLTPCLKLFSLLPWPSKVKDTDFGTAAIPCETQLCAVCLLSAPHPPKQHLVIVTFVS